MTKVLIRTLAVRIFLHDCWKYTQVHHYREDQHVLCLINYNQEICFPVKCSTKFKRITQNIHSSIFKIYQGSMFQITLKIILCQGRWHRLVMPALWRLEYENPKFKVSLRCIVRLSTKHKSCRHFSVLDSLLSMNKSSGISSSSITKVQIRQKKQNLKCQIHKNIRYKDVTMKISKITSYNYH